VGLSGANGFNAVARRARDSHADTRGAASRPERGTPVKAFGLTPAEVRVASIIARGLSPEPAAEELSVAKVTVRNQIKSTSGKTDTHRQSELVALLSRI
jgi:DNA-binding CsgD family transcriptional regulator